MLARWSASSLAGLTALIHSVSRLPEAPLELKQCLNDYQVLNSGPAGVWTNSGHPWTWMQKKKKEIASLFSRTSNLKFSMSSNKREDQDRRGCRSCESVINRNRRHAPVNFQWLQIQEALFQKYSMCIQADSEKCSSCKVLVSFLWCCFGDSSLSVEARNLVGIHCMTMHPDRFRSFIILKEWCYRWTCTWSFHACESKQWRLQSLHSLPLRILIHTAPLCNLESFFSTISLKP